MNLIEIFTDGACRGNPGPGGWGALIRINGQEESLWGGEKNTTNNRMEMLAAIKSLDYFSKSSSVSLTTDSGYVKDGITKWIEGWKRKDWKKADKTPVKNKDLWLELNRLNEFHTVTWKWVKGHSGHRENEIADMLANKGIDELDK
jgi:ribonuclease HI